MPARPKRPRDKAAVEGSVKLIQRSLRLIVNQRPPMSIAELRYELARVVEIWNNRVMRRANGHSRRTLFEQHERSHLAPLPVERFELWTNGREGVVAKDYHVEFAGNYYSVPSSDIGKKARARATSRTVQILIDGCPAVTHPRCHGQSQLVTNPDHRPPNHQAYAEGDLGTWAAAQGSDVEVLVAAEVAIERTCGAARSRSRWIRDLPRLHGKQRFLTACRRAVAMQDLRFEHVENVLKRSLEGTLPELGGKTALKPTRNVRGRGFYKRGSGTNG